jgi:dephospho-CoA kinase
LKLSLKKRLNWLREMIFLTKNEGIRIKLFFDYFYPLIKQSICSSFANNQGKLIILECPILFNLNWESQIDKIILLTSYRKLKVNRFENKRKSLSWTKVKINKLLTYQLNNLNIKAQKSDYIVSNNKSKKHLFQKIESILTSFLR